MKNVNAQRVAAICLIGAITVYRICVGLSGGHPGWLENFSPVAAVALCGGVYLPRRIAFAVPLAGLLISDLVLNWHYHAAPVSAEMLLRYGALALSVWIGITVRENAGLARVLGASAVGSGIFYLVTNTGSWLAEPGYAKTLAGWTQALWMGLPGYAPTWTFFRSSLISDLLFTALFVGCMAVTRERAVEPPAAGVARAGR